MSGGGPGPGGESSGPSLGIISLIVGPRPGVLPTPEHPGVSGQRSVLGGTMTTTGGRREPSLCSVLITTDFKIVQICFCNVPNKVNPERLP